MQPEVGLLDRTAVPDNPAVESNEVESNTKSRASDVPEISSFEIFKMANFMTLLLTSTIHEDH